MQIIVETGSVVPNANSFVSVVFADEYFLNHPHLSVNWSALNTGRKEVLLAWAALQMADLFAWRGSILSANQTLCWPRVGVIDSEGRLLPSNAIPLRVKQAQCEMAIYLATGDQESASDSANLDEVKVDVITVKFRGSSSARAVPRPASRLLTGLAVAYSSIRVGKVIV